MLKEIDHLKKVKRLRIGDTDVESLKPVYEVSNNASSYNVDCNINAHPFIDSVGTPKRSVW